MRPIIFFAVLTGFSPWCSRTSFAQTAPEKRPLFVGAIFIVGNDFTPDRMIRETVSLFPGQTLRMEDIRKAENRLKQLRFLDAKSCSISVLDAKDESFKPLLVTVKEAETVGLSLELILLRAEIRVQNMPDKLMDRTEDLLDLPRRVRALLLGQSTARFRGLMNTAVR